MSLLLAMMFNLFDGCETAWIAPDGAGGFYGVCGDASGRQATPRPNPVTSAIDTFAESIEVIRDSVSF